MKDLKIKEKFIQMRAKGLSFDKIAEEVGVTKTTLITWSKELKIEIANMRTIELDSLLEQYYISKQQRIETFWQRT